MPSMLSLSVFHGLQSSLDSQQSNPDDIKPKIHRWLRPACDATKNLAAEENRVNFHGLNSENFVGKPALNGAPPPPVTYTKPKLSRNNNLDMCTETLGCETGAMCSAYELEIDSVKKKKKNNPPPRSAPPQEFPPPLTTLSGEGRLRLGRKREEGRLLLIPFKPFVLESERFGGRLLLRILPEKDMGGRGGGEENKELVDKDEDGVEEMGCFVNGSGGKYKRSGRCKKGEGGGVGRKKMGTAAIFNCDSFWVAST